MLASRSSLTSAWVISGFLMAGMNTINAQPAAVPDRRADTAVDPILERSETAEIVFGEIYISDAFRVILRTGSSADDYDYTEYEVGEGTELFVDGNPARLDDMQFEPGTPARLVPYGEDSFMLERVYVGEPAAPMDDDDPVEAKKPGDSGSDGRSTPSPDASGDFGASSTPSEDFELDLNPVAEVPIGAEFETVRRGLKIVAITADGPVSRTRFQLGDVVIQVDGKPVLTADSMYRRLHQFQPGDLVRLEAMRDGEMFGDELKLPDDFEPQPLDSPDETAAQSEAGNATGRRADRPTPPVVGLGWILVNTRAGVVIQDIDPDQPASDAGFREGDRVFSVAGHVVGAARAVYDRLHHFNGGEPVAIEFERDGERMTKRIILPDDFEPIYADGE